MTRFAVAALAIFLLTGMASCGPHHQQRDLVHLRVLHPGGNNIFSSNEAVDSAANHLTKLLQEKQLIHNNTRKSFGVQPWTGHTQNIHVTLASNSNVYGHVEIAKSYVLIRFREIERELKSGIYDTTPNENSQVSSTAETLKKYLTKNYGQLSFIQLNQFGQSEP